MEDPITSVRQLGVGALYSLYTAAEEFEDEWSTQLVGTVECLGVGEHRGDSIAVFRQLNLADDEENLLLLVADDDLNTFVAVLPYQATPVRSTSPQLEPAE